MFDKEVLLAFINGPGSGFTWMVIALFALIFGLAALRAGMKNAYNEGKNLARREGLENLQASIARLIHDQQEIKNRITLEPGE